MGSQGHLVALWPPALGVKLKDTVLCLAPGSSQHLLCRMEQASGGAAAAISTQVQHQGQECWLLDKCYTRPEQKGNPRRVLVASGGHTQG